MADVSLPRPFVPYNGNEPFIFVSYAHKDAALVYPEIERMHKQGYRIWYDEGIDPGNEWPLEIEKAVKASSLFIVFISDQAVESRNVRDEVNLAISRNIPFLAIFFDDVELKYGMELRLSSIQAVYKFRMPEEKYLRKLEITLAPDLRDPGKEDFVVPISAKPVSPDKEDYETVKIGEQVWMKKNLSVKTYRNGDPIPEAKTPEIWNKKRGAWCYYDNDPRNGEEFGLLYNWYALNDMRGLAPEGWHVPDKAEFEKLAQKVNKDARALKPVGVGMGAGVGTNSSGFSALFSNGRKSDGSFEHSGKNANFWTSKEWNDDMAYSLNLSYSGSSIFIMHCEKGYGFSVRCLKDV